MCKFRWTIVVEKIYYFPEKKIKRTETWFSLSTLSLVPTYEINLFWWEQINLIDEINI